MEFQARMTTSIRRHRSTEAPCRVVFRAVCRVVCQAEYRVAYQEAYLGVHRVAFRAESPEGFRVGLMVEFQAVVSISFD